MGNMEIPPGMFRVVFITLSMQVTFNLPRVPSKGETVRLRGVSYLVDNVTTEIPDPASSDLGSGPSYCVALEAE